MMNKLCTALFLILSISSKAQTSWNCDSLIEVLDTKNNKVNTHTKEILSETNSWKEIAVYDMIKKTLVLDSTSLKILSKKRIKYVTDHDKLTIKGSNSFEIIFGGKGPERQTYKIVYYDKTCLILESEFTNKGFYNGKKIFIQKKNMRYLWIKN